MVDQEGLELISLVGVDTLVGLNISEEISNLVNAILALTFSFCANIHCIIQPGSIDLRFSIDYTSKSRCMLHNKIVGFFISLFSFVSQFFYLRSVIVEFVLKLRHFLVVSKVVLMSLASIIELFSHALVLFFDIFANA